MIKKIIILSVFVALISCENRDIDFDDFDYQTVYFPYQYPARTLVLGESRSDNSIDLEHAFNIGVGIGGLYENTKDRVVKIAYAPELLSDDIQVGGTGRPVKELPKAYYEAPFDEIVIPQGEFSGKMRIQLNDAFFQDSLSIDVNYVIPLIITSETEDSVLVGRSYLDHPDRRKAADWEAGYLPKDYTLFAVKYINSNHGTYLLRGVSYRLDAADNAVDTAVYRQQHITENFVELLSTVSLSENTLFRVGGKNDVGQNINLVFNDEAKTISIVEAKDGGLTNVSGSGTFLEADDEGAEIWGEIPHRTLFLDYSYELAGVKYHVKDTLVYRDNDLTHEEFSIVFP